MDDEARQRFAAHLAACPECELEIEGLAAVLLREAPDTSRVEEAVRRRMAASRSRRRWALAAGVLVAMVGSYEWLAWAPRRYVDAARDHRAEVVERQPRRWRSGAAEIEVLAAGNGLTLAEAAGLAPEGYRLEHAKICGIDGQRMLHLVFTNGTREYSIYVSPDRSAQEGVRRVERDAEQVAGFETGRFRALVVTVGPAAECEELARLAAGRL